MAGSTLSRLPGLVHVIVPHVVVLGAPDVLRPSPGAPDPVALPRVPSPRAPVRVAPAVSHDGGASATSSAHSAGSTTSPPSGDLGPAAGRCSGGTSQGRLVDVEDAVVRVPHDRLAHALRLGLD